MEHFSLYGAIRHINVIVEAGKNGGQSKTCDGSSSLLVAWQILEGLLVKEVGTVLTASVNLDSLIDNTLDVGRPYGV